MKFLFLISLISIFSIAFAQVPGTWETFADASISRCAVVFEGKAYFGTKGGVVEYNPQTHSTRIMTNVDGLGGLDVVSLAVHEGELYYASANGGVGRLEGNFWETYSGFIRSNIAMKRLISAGDFLFAATGQGVFKLKPLHNGSEPVELAESYTKLGAFAMNSPVNAVAADDSMLWVGTPEGLAWARLDANLFVPDAWNNIEIDRAVTAILADSGGVWFALSPATGEKSIFWTNGTETDSVSDSYMNNRDLDGFFYYKNELYMHGHSGLFVCDGPDDFHRIMVANHFAAHGGAVLGDSLYVGLEIGFGAMNGNDSIYANTPNAPQGTGFVGAAAGPNGEMWFISRSYGLSRYENGVWTNFNSSTIDSTDSLSEYIHAKIRNVWEVEVDPRGIVWIGTNGAGLFRYYPDEERWEVFNEANSFLRGLSEDEGVVVCRALEYDEERGIMWVSNYAASSILAVAGVILESDLTEPLVAYYGGISDIPTNYVQGLGAGSGRLWIVIKDDGITMLDLGPSLESADDDFTKNYNEELPSASALKVAVDSSGTAWVAVDGGVAKIDPSIETAIIQQLPEHVSLGVADIQVDVWNNVWIATDDGAAMFRSADSSWMAIKSRFGANADGSERTDLFTDLLYAVAVNPINGDIWFCGEGGVSVFHTGFSNTTDKPDDLMATPNPFVWNGMASQKTIIRNVPADADVHIYSADGMLVRTIPISERGPSATAEWDGRNDSGKPVATGIYIMIAPSKSGVAKGKVAFVRE